MSILNETTSGGRPTDLGVSDKGKMYFETDTNNIVVWDGTNWRGCQTDGITFGGTSYVAQLNHQDQYLRLGDVSSTLGGAVKCSISWWMKQPTISGTPAHRRVWQMGDTYSNLFVYCYSDRLHLGAGVSTDAFKTVKTSGSSTIVADNEWHLWTVVYNGTQLTDATKLVIYRDDALQTMVSDDPGIPSSLLSTTGDEPHIGALYNTTVSDFSDASFDDFAIFDDALTSTQIANIYHGQTYPSSLKHLYRFENNVNDSVGGADGTDVNGPSITNSPSSLPY